MDSSPTDPAVDRERERAVDVPSLAGGGSSRPAGVTDGREGQEDTDEQPPQATTTDGDDPASPPATVAGEGGDDGRTLALADETPSTRTASDGAAAAAEMDPPSTTSLTSLTQSLNEFERLPLESGIAIWSGGRLLALIDPTFSLAPPPGATLPPSTSALPTPEPPRPSRDEVLEAMSPIAQSAEISERASSELDALAQSFRSAVQAVPSASRNVVDERAHLLESLLVEVWDATEQVLAGEGRSGREALGRIADAVRGTSEVRVLARLTPRDQSTHAFALWLCRLQHWIKHPRLLFDAEGPSTDPDSPLPRLRSVLPRTRPVDRRTLTLNLEMPLIPRNAKRTGRPFLTPTCPCSPT